MGFAYGEKTIWDQMPNSEQGKYAFFKKVDSQGVFKRYELMRGTRLIFACVNAQTFFLYAFQQDSLKDKEGAKEEINKQCDQTIDMNSDPNKPPFLLPLGMPVFLKFEKDFGAYEGYQDSLTKWTPVASNDEAQIFISKGKYVVSPEGYRKVWVLTNFNKEMKAGSAITLREFDCRQKRFRFVTSYTYPEKYGRGKKLQDQYSDNKWSYAPPDSMHEVLVDLACKL